MDTFTCMIHLNTLVGWGVGGKVAINCVSASLVVPQHCCAVLDSVDMQLC